MYQGRLLKLLLNVITSAVKTPVRLPCLPLLDALLCFTVTITELLSQVGNTSSPNRAPFTGSTKQAEDNDTPNSEQVTRFKMGSTPPKKSFFKKLAGKIDLDVPTLLMMLKYENQSYLAPDKANKGTEEQLHPQSDLRRRLSQITYVL